MKRHLALRARYQLEGKINHENVFFRDNGVPIRNLNDPYDRWWWTLKHTLRARYREPYNARHSFVSWSLMVGKNVLWLAKQLGHSVQTMLTAYAAWVEGAKESDVEAIRVALERTPPALLNLLQAARSPLRSPGAVTRLSLEPPAGRRK